MQCRACGFNNLPGTERCVRCQALLVAPVSDDGETYYPPRAGWLKPFQQFLYRWSRLRNCMIRLCEGQRIAIPWASVSGSELHGDHYWHMLISIVPGLGHIYRNRTGWMLWLLMLLWSALVFVTVNLCFLYPRVTSSTAAAMLILHSALIFDAGDVRNSGLTRLRKFIIILMICFLVGLSYLIIWAVFLWSLGWKVSEIQTNDPSLRRGEIINTSSVPADITQLRGCLVNCYTDRFAKRIGHNQFTFPEGDFDGYLFALPGDVISKKNGSIYVNEKELLRTSIDPDAYNGYPANLVVEVPDGYCMVRFYGVEHTPRLNSEYYTYLWTEWYMVKVEDISSVITGVRLPLWRWHNFSQEQ